jgi:2-methylisocitrate lyase-like PEP mutase family enzyme
MTGHIDQLRALLERDANGRRTLISVPGCWDGLTALMIAEAGFPCAFLSGGAFSMARLGRPDVGLVTASELVDTVALIRDRVDLPLIVDADTGFGNALNLQRSVRALERAGASALQIEDQRFPKRCGHLAGKQVVPLDEAVGRIRAALDTRDEALIIARTDAAGVEGMDAAMDRIEAFAEAGADILFLEGPPTLATIEQVGQRFGHLPLVHNLVDGGNSEVTDGATLERLGFAIALHPLVLLSSLLRDGTGVLSAVRGARSSAALDLPPLGEFNSLLGTQLLLAHAEGYDA